MDVELPYATKVLTQELASIMNVGLRFITTGDTQRLRPFKPLDPDVRITKVLQEMPPIPEPIQSQQIPKLEDVTQQIPLEALVAMGVESARLVAEAQAKAAEEAPIPDEDAPVEVTGDQTVITLGQPQVPGLEAVAAEVAADENEPVVLVPQVLGQQPTVQQYVQPGQQPRSILRRANQNVVIQPPPVILEEVPPGPPARLFPSPIPGAPPTIAVANPAPAIINVDTSPAAMAAQGLAAPLIQQNATLRRSSANIGNFTVNRMGSEPGGGPPPPSTVINVRKLE